MMIKYVNGNYVLDIIKTVCKKCGTVFTYEGKRYRNSGIIVRKRFVCDECQDKAQTIRLTKYRKIKRAIKNKNNRRKNG